MGDRHETNMPATLFRLSAFALLLCACAASIPLATFDDAAGTTFKFIELNDPVMGGKSTGTWSLDAAGKFGVFDGEVKDVPSLKAPGFIKAAGSGTFPDVSSALGGDLVLTVRSSTPSYAGFRITFAAGTKAPPYACGAGGSLPFSRGCFKSKFSVPAGEGWSTVRVPINSFSDKWSPATGEHTKDCATDADVCPTAKSLSGIKRLEIWAEGALGKVHLEVKSVVAEQSASLVALDNKRPAPEFDSCSAAVQDDLKFNISTRMDSFAQPGAAVESMAAAVCCDKRNLKRAEPRFLFEAPDIQMFSLLDNGVTTFYDSVCGIPLFRAPVNRTLADFEADTNEHGWPSFRPDEVVQENVVTVSPGPTKPGMVTSKCGTHLGSYLPDARGPRWCMDLSCIAGKAVKLVEIAPAGDETTLYKISNGECGQAVLVNKFVSYAKKFAGLSPGTCPEHGYTATDGTQVLKVPVLGDVTIAKFKKA